VKGRSVKERESDIPKLCECVMFKETEVEKEKESEIETASKRVYTYVRDRMRRRDCLAF